MIKIYIIIFILTNSFCSCLQQNSFVPESLGFWNFVGSRIQIICREDWYFSRIFYFSNTCNPDTTSSNSYFESLVGCYLSGPFRHFCFDHQLLRAFYASSTIKQVTPRDHLYKMGESRPMCHSEFIDNFSKWLGRAPAALYSHCIWQFEARKPRWEVILSLPVRYGTIPNLYFIASWNYLNWFLYAHGLIRFLEVFHSIIYYIVVVQIWLQCKMLSTYLF